MGGSGRLETCKPPEAPPGQFAIDLAANAYRRSMVFYRGIPSRQFRMTRTHRDGEKTTDRHSLSGRKRTWNRR